MHEAREMATVANRLGLHARPAAVFVKLATSFESEVWVEKDGLEVNAKSIMGVMMLAAESGARLAIRALGSDAVDAVAALTDLVGRGFDDDESEYEMAPDEGTGG